MLLKSVSRLSARISPVQSSIYTAPIVSNQFLGQQFRMSSSTIRREWMALIPDHPGALEKRKSVRPEHFSKLQTSIKDQSAVFGGCTYTEHPQDPKDPGDMNGSFIVIQAETKEQALEWIKNDIYTKSGVWDADKAQIWPFKSAFRTPV